MPFKLSALRRGIVDSDVARVRGATKPLAARHSTARSSLARSTRHFDMERNIRYLLRSEAGEKLVPQSGGEVLYIIPHPRYQEGQTTHRYRIHRSRDRNVSGPA